jgi:dienelactone hydrolase
MRKTKHVFYLHGMIVEVQGVNAVSDLFGPYKYQDIIDSLNAAGYEVHSEVRTAKTEDTAFCKQISNEIDQLLADGVSPRDITVIGASKGGMMAMQISDQNPNPVNYILLAANSTRLENSASWKLHGHILGIYETSDDIGGKDYTYWKDRSVEAKEFKQLKINTGLGHGFLYRPIKEWMEPARVWIDRK